VCVNALIDDQVCGRDLSGGDHSQLCLAHERFVVLGRELAEDTGKRISAARRCCCQLTLNKLLSDLASCFTGIAGYFMIPSRMVSASA
jgi:hypothetical protein